MQGEPGPPASVPVALGLNHTETQILARLITQGCLSREQICAIASRAHQPIKIGSVGAVVHGLRKKLAGHEITIASVSGFGFELRPRDRAKVLDLLAAQPRQPAGDVLVRKSDPQGRIEPETSQTRSNATGRSFGRF
jgi:hypothetical protein